MGYLLTVSDSKDERGYYLVEYCGREFALASSINEGFGYGDGYWNDRMSLSMTLWPLPPEKPTPPKRSWAKRMGLRKAAH
jgi:hypothetical protein